MFPFSQDEKNKNDPSGNKISEHKKKRIESIVDTETVTSRESSSSSDTFYEDDILPIRKVNYNHAVRKDKAIHINLTDLNSPRKSTRSSVCDSEDIPFGREGMPTCRPVGTEHNSMKSPGKDDLKRLIQMVRLYNSFIYGTLFNCAYVLNILL